MNPWREKCKERNKEGFEKVTESKKKGSSSRQDREETSRPTSGEDPKFGVICVQDQGGHRLDWFGLVFHRAEAKEEQGGQSKGYCKEGNERLDNGSRPKGAGIQRKRSQRGQRLGRESREASPGGCGKTQHQNLPVH